MIKGSTLVYGGRTVYVDTLFPATWYINEKENVIALYCGAYEAYNKKLQKTFVVAGGYGGYFDDRSEIESDDGSIIYSPPRDEMPPSSVQALTKKADGIYLINVKNAPAWGEGIDIKGSYELEVTKIIKGDSRASFNLARWQCPGVMHAERLYVLFTRNVAAQTGGTSIIFADGVYHSAFEINDDGYVLPIREYGMKAPMKLAAFLKMCK